MSIFGEYGAFTVLRLNMIHLILILRLSQECRSGVHGGLFQQRWQHKLPETRTLPQRYCLQS